MTKENKDAIAEKLDEILSDNAVPEHDEVVRKLRKPAELLLDELSANTADITHMAIGLVTECRELCQAIFNNDKENIGEEIGDFVFYMTGLRQAINDGYEYEPQEPITYATGYDVTGFIMQSMNVLDYVKKAYAYARDLDVDNVMAILAELEHHVLQICITHNVSLSEAIKANGEKLWLKRYPNGYTNDAATDRADKVDGQ